MTTTPVTLLSKRSGNTSDRPLDTTVQAGELAINFAAAENGLYFKDSVGDIRKVTGVHYGTNAPNSSPAGATGNSVGELWLEDGTNNFLRIWDGSSFIKIGAAFADVAGTATVSIASGAIVANSALVASGAFGAVSASGALGTPIASGALLASGALGTPIASGLEVLTISGAFPTVPASGVFGYRVDPPSGLYLSFGGGWVPVS
tara:strand:- start:11918 stop:12529 length:612 start_codon:yes stop_codon:yes gene_type:complete